MNRTADGLGLLTIACVIVACSAQSEGEAAPTFAVPSGEVADMILYNGMVLTMEEIQPAAQAVAVQGETILAVGSDADVLTLKGSETRMIDLEGRTLLPGFIDSHAHRLMKWEEGGYDSMEAAARDAVANGWTSTNELSVSRSLLEEFAALDQAGRLPLRVNVYLTLNYWPDIYGDWYRDYEPSSSYTPHVRIAGAKIFMDGNWGTDIWLAQDELDALVAEAHAAGWQIAVHAVGETSTDMTLDALVGAMGDSGVAAERPRIEHAVFLRDDQIARLHDLGAIASLELNAVGEYPLSSSWEELVVRQGRRPWVGRVSDLLDAGVTVTGSTDAPFLYNPAYAELPGAPFGSPMRTVYQAVTRTGHGGAPPQRWMLRQAITSDEALRLLTLNGAYGTFEEEVKGSIAPGKLADLVVLSDNPLAVPTPDLLDIEVLMTVVGGRVVHCQPAWQSACPERSEERERPLHETSVRNPATVPGDRLPHTR